MYDITLLSILISFFAAAAACLVLHNRKIIEFSSLLASCVALVQSIRIGFHVAQLGTYDPSPFFSVDALGATIMLIIACVSIAATAYSIEYLRQETAKNIIGFSGVSHVRSRVREYFILLNLFMAMMFLCISVSSPIFAWIFIEATTLSTAFLISFYNKPSAIEGAWKYLIINSIGILLAFFGTLLYFTSPGALVENGIVSWHSLLINAAHLDPQLIKVAFIFVFIGYGTKVGFAPMHTWKPDAYSKTPAAIGALFSGALLPVAFAIILKFKVITDAVIGASFSQQLFIIFGLLSIAVASIIIFVTRNYKRLLAYSSIENAGIMALGFGFGGIGVFFAMLHMIYHSFIKSALFFLSGNFLLKYHSAKIANIKGAINAIPMTAVLFLTGFFAITGAPPFGIFFTKILILSAGISMHPFVSIAVMVLITLLFIGFLKHATAMVFGKNSADTKKEKENIWLLIPPAVLIIATLWLSFYIPPFLYTLLKDISLHY